MAPPTSVRKVVVGASIGNVVEWFEFGVYGLLAVYVAAKFFPSGNDAARRTWSPSSPTELAAWRPRTT